MPFYTDRPSCSSEPAINYQNPNCWDATRLQAWLVRREAEVHGTTSETTGQLDRLMRVRAFADFAARAIGKRALKLDPKTEALGEANFRAEKALLCELSPDQLTEYLYHYVGCAALADLAGDAGNE